MSITLEEAQSLLAKLANNELDRGTFYLKVFELTGSPAALFQAHVSLFSGWLGGTALGANYLLTDGAKHVDPLVNSGLPASGYSDNKQACPSEEFPV